MSEPHKRKRRGERDDGRIQVTYTDGRNPDGTPHRVAFYGRTRAEAEAKREQYKDRVGRGIVPEAVTVSEWVDKWIEVYAINTEMYRPYISRLRSDLGCMLITDVTEANLMRSLRAGFEGRSSSGAVKYRMILQQVFKRARVNRLIAFDPSEALQLPKAAPAVGHRALARWEIEHIISNWRECRAGLWALIMLLAGLRRGELMALAWENVDLVNRQINVCQTAVIKGNRTVIEPRAKTLAGVRCVPICQALFNALDSVPQASRHGYVCLSARGEKLTEHAFSRGWEGFNNTMQRLLNNEDIDQRGRRTDLNPSAPAVPFEVRPHDLRHTFCTLLYDGGIDVKNAAYLMGHSDTRVTLEIYTHLSTERQKKSAAALVGILDDFNVV